uniref:Uncharacterized protein n=1 Tax=Pleurozia purpurea TaxID=280637 RepID=D0R049_9MARC|nr:hypothetical protein PlpuMp50 [Pleurozia purpurea]ACR19386.1 hypothetical protein PlpuMp50 [Pleurozia purpurea]
MIAYAMIAYAITFLSVEPGNETGLFIYIASVYYIKLRYKIINDNQLQFYRAYKDSWGAGGLNDANRTLENRSDLNGNRIPKRNMGSCGLANAAPKHAPETLPAAATGTGRLATIVAGGAVGIATTKMIADSNGEIQKSKMAALKEYQHNLANMALELGMNPSKHTRTSSHNLRTHGQSWILHARHVTELGQTGGASSYRTCRHPYRVSIRVKSLYCLKKLLTPERPLGQARHRRYSCWLRFL